MSIEKADPLNEERRVIGECFSYNFIQAKPAYISFWSMTRVANYLTILFSRGNFVII